VEGAEDSPEQGAADLAALDPPLSPHLDTVIGLAASGRTPYALGGIDYARNLGCFTAGICCVSPSAMQGVAELVVECPVGPEVVTGSTRMKSGTAQKMILNMISTGVQLKIGKTYGNLMVDVKRSNIKLINRARLIFRSVLQPIVDQGATLDIDLADDLAIDDLMDACGGSVKRSMVAARWRCTPDEATRRLDAADGLLKTALATRSAPNGVVTNGTNGHL
jgi:N-acetylmuramic acid 6-phosphate etherase